MAVSLYRRLGFTERCLFRVHATGPLFAAVDTKANSHKI
jgi:hypothetical protein